MSHTTTTRPDDTLAVTGTAPVDGTARPTVSHETPRLTSRTGAALLAGLLAVTVVAAGLGYRAHQDSQPAPAAPVSGPGTADPAQGSGTDAAEILHGHPGYLAPRVGQPAHATAVTPTAGRIHRWLD